MIGFPKSSHVITRSTLCETTTDISLSSDRESLQSIDSVAVYGWQAPLVVELGGGVYNGDMEVRAIDGRKQQIQPQGSIRANAGSREPED